MHHLKPEWWFNTFCLGSCIQLGPGHVPGGPGQGEQGDWGAAEGTAGCQGHKVHGNGTTSDGGKLVLLIIWKYIWYSRCGTSPHIQRSTQSCPKSTSVNSVSNIWRWAIYFSCCYVFMYFLLQASSVMKRHAQKCVWKHPPGDEIYRKDKLSVFEVWSSVFFDVFLKK